MTHPIRVATICHNEADHNDPHHVRIRLELTKSPDGGYVWRTEDEDDCNLGNYSTVYNAEIAAMHAWGADCWDLRATWRR